MKDLPAPRAGDPLLSAAAEAVHYDGRRETVLRFLIDRGTISGLRHSVEVGYCDYESRLTIPIGDCVSYSLYRTRNDTVFAF